MKESEETEKTAGKQEDETESETDAEDSTKSESKKPAKKIKKPPAKPRIKPSFYYVSSSDDEASTLKDRFWKDLEDGKVDIFRTADLYSTIKGIGRSARPKCLAESDLRGGLRSSTIKQNAAEEISETVVEETPKRSKRKTAVPKLAKTEKPTAKKQARTYTPAKPRIKPSFYYVSTSEDEDSVLKDQKNVENDEEKPIGKTRARTSNISKGLSSVDTEKEENSVTDEVASMDTSNHSENKEAEQKLKKEKKVAEDQEEECEADEEEEEKENVKIKEEKKRIQKVTEDRSIIIQHLEETIDQVIAESAAMWEERYSNEDKLEEDMNSQLEENESSISNKTSDSIRAGKKHKKRKQNESNDESESPGRGTSVKVISQTKKNAKSQIAYISEDEMDAQTELSVPTKKTKKRPRKAGNDSSLDTVEKKYKTSGQETIKHQATSSDSSSLEAFEKESGEVDQGIHKRTLEESASVGDKKIKMSFVDVEKESVHLSSEKHANKDSQRVKDNESGKNGTSTGIGDHENSTEMSADSQDSVTVPSVEENLDHLIFDLQTVTMDSLEQNERLSVRARNIRTPLTNEDLRNAVKSNDFDAVEVMIRNADHFDLEQADTKTGTTLTMIATQDYFLEIVEMLILNGADVDAKRKDGGTALFIACEKGFHCAVSLLLCLGANVNSHLPSGETPLMVAVKKNHYHVVRILLEHGVNISAASVGERHALSVARQLNQQPMVELLTAHKVRLTTELLQQVGMALEGSAKIGSSVFPIQCFRLCDGNQFRVDFRHELQPTQTSRGMLLFFGHGCGSASDSQLKLYGSCAVTKAILNNITLQSLYEDNNFIMTFCPLRDGHNHLEIFTAPLCQSTYKVHLVVSAFVVTLL